MEDVWIGEGRFLLRLPSLKGWITKECLVKSCDKLLERWLVWNMCSIIIWNNRCHFSLLEKWLVWNTRSIIIWNNRWHFSIWNFFSWKVQLKLLFFFFGKKLKLLSRLTSYIYGKSAWCCHAVLKWTIMSLDLYTLWDCNVLVVLQCLE